MRMRDIKIGERYVLSKPDKVTREAKFKKGLIVRVEEKFETVISASIQGFKIPLWPKEISKIKIPGKNGATIFKGKQKKEIDGLKELEKFKETFLNEATTRFGIDFERTWDRNSWPKKEKPRETKCNSMDLNEIIGQPGTRIETRPIITAGLFTTTTPEKTKEKLQSAYELGFEHGLKMAGDVDAAVKKIDEQKELFFNTLLK